MRRPAAVIEDLRRSAAQNPPRILLLQEDNKPSPQLVKLQALLRIGGIRPVQMHSDDMNEEALASAQPDLVIHARERELLDQAVRSQALPHSCHRSAFARAGSRQFSARLVILQAAATAYYLPVIAKYAGGSEQQSGANPQ